MIPQKPELRHIIIKLMNVKGKDLKAAITKQLAMYKETPIRLAADLPPEVL